MYRNANTKLVSIPVSPSYTVECGDLPIPSNGIVSYSDTTLINSVATFTCSESYIVTGDSTRTCLLTGMWSGIQPSCERELRSSMYLYLLRTCDCIHSVFILVQIKIFMFVH